MRKARTFLTAVCLAGAMCLASARTQAGELTVAEFDKLHKEMTSAREEWQKLPWHLSLMKACAQAAPTNA